MWLIDKRLQAEIEAMMQAFERNDHYKIWLLCLQLYGRVPSGPETWLWRTMQTAGELIACPN